MAKGRFRLFTAERAGLLTVAALILFIAATAMCSRTSCAPNRSAPAAADTALVKQIDSAILTPPDTIKKKKPRKQKKKANPKPRPYTRNHRQEIVDTI